MTRRALHILAAIVIVVLAIGLYKAKSDAARAEANVRHLQTEIADAEADLRALRAEIARQESPARVERLAERYLDRRVGQGQPALPANAIDTHLPAPQPADQRP